ncbi:MAG: GDSL-type esterase/lipase family protein [Bryobacteraceae bacterium]
MPVKTALTIVAFAALIFLPRVVPALKNYESLDAGKITAVFDLPLPKMAGTPETETADAHLKRLAANAPSNLFDPAHELDHFYQALLEGDRTVRILHYGDSPTTADLITADARVLFQQQFGDAGSGFVLIARPWAWYNHRGVDMDDASSWTVDIAGVTEVKDGMHGLGGVSFTGTPGASAHWKLKNNPHDSIEVAYLRQPDGGAFEVEAEGKPLGEVQTESNAIAPGFAAFKIPAGAKNFSVQVTSGTARLYGVEFRKGSPGVIYSSLGINGANVTLLSRSFNQRHWEAELRHYKPDLVIVNYGTNESGFANFVDTTWASEMKEAVRRIHAALPETSVLLMSPMDRGEKKPDGTIGTISTLPRLVNIEARLGAATGTAFFNTYEAMGGAGTMARWYAAEPRLVGADYIHPMPGGAKIVGALLYEALRDGYNQYKLRQLDTRVPVQPK